MAHRNALVATLLVLIVGCNLFVPYSPSSARDSGDKPDVASDLVAPDLASDLVAPDLAPDLAPVFDLAPGDQLIAPDVYMAQGLVAYYSFDGHLKDQSGNNHHGIDHGGVSFVGGHMNQALHLDGIDDYVELNRVVEEDFSVAFWVRTTATAPAGPYWFEGLGIVDGEMCGNPTGGDWGIALINGGRVSFLYYQSQSTVNDNKWHPVVAVRRMSPSKWILYIDGQEEFSYNEGPEGPITGPEWLGVGNNPCSAGNEKYFPGDVDELRFYNRALSLQEVKALSGKCRCRSGGDRPLSPVLSASTLAEARYHSICTTGVSGIGERGPQAVL